MFLGQRRRDARGLVARLLRDIALDGGTAPRERLPCLLVDFLKRAVGIGDLPGNRLLAFELFEHRIAEGAEEAVPVASRQLSIISGEASTTHSEKPSAKACPVSRESSSGRVWTSSGMAGGWCGAPVSVPSRSRL